MPQIKALFAKLDIVHLILILTFVGSTALPDLVSAETLVGVGAWVPVTLKIGTYLSGLLMLLKQFSPVPAPVPATADTIQAQAAKLRPLGVLLMLGVVLVLVGCGAGQLFGPGSVIPSDMQADEACVSAELLKGDDNPVTIGVNCSIAEGKTLTDLLSWVLDALGAKLPTATQAKLGTYVTAQRSAGK